MDFFRGIAVPSAAVVKTIEKIQHNGLLPDQGKWIMPYFRPDPIEALFSKDDLSFSDTRPREEEESAICACGEQEGAAYYAWKHNRTCENDTPIMIEVEADENSVAVDGRDFLYATFQWGDPGRTRSVLEQGFGRAVLRYAEKAWESEDQCFRIALCDLATYDPDVIRAHYANDLVFGGRHGTIFRNAFIIKLPIKPEALIRVWSPSIPPSIPTPDVSLKDVLPS